MRKFVTFLCILATVALVFSTSLAAVFFVHSYFKAIETQDLLSQVKEVKWQHNKYTTDLLNAKAHPIEAKDKDGVSEAIAALAKDNDLIYEEISMKPEDQYYAYKVNLVGSKEDIAKFISQLTDQEYLISISSLEMEGQAQEYKAELEYHLFKIDK